MRSLLHELALAIWAFRPDAVSAYTPQVREIMQGRGSQNTTTRAEAELMREAQLCFYTADGRRLEAGVDEVTPESGLVAVLNVSGPIMKSDYCGAPGAITMSKWLNAFEATPEVTGVVLRTDSPGGNGYGMLTMTSQMERMSKPVVSLVEQGMACSAAYGIAAASDLVFTAGAMDEVGSIGTYVRLFDWSGADEKDGLKVHEIYATRSQDKNALVKEAFQADPKDPNDKHYTAIREQYIDPFNEHFIELVQRNRPGVKDANGALSGKVFMSGDALKHGLIDSTGQTLESAIAAVRNLSTKKTNN
jgi:protease-4